MTVTENVCSPGRARPGRRHGTAGGASAAAAARRHVRPRRPRRAPVGRRAAAGRDPQGALPRLPGADPRRADCRARAAGRRAAVRDRSPDSPRTDSACCSSAHKLREVAAVTDRVSVLRRGRIIDTIDAAGVEPRYLAELMVGRPTDAVAADTAAETVDLAVAKVARRRRRVAGADGGSRSRDREPDRRGTRAQRRRRRDVAGESRRDRGDRRRLRQRAAPARRRAVRHRQADRRHGPRRRARRDRRPGPTGCAPVSAASTRTATAAASPQPQRRAQPRVRAPRRSSAADRSSTAADSRIRRRGDRTVRHPRGPGRHRSAHCPAATSRRCCSPACLCASRRRRRGASRPAAWTSAPPNTSTASCATARQRRRRAAGLRGPRRVARPVRPDRRPVRGAHRRRAAGRGRDTPSGSAC